eukprot:1488723-Pyramimonas_sp.AAC.1
MVAKYVMVRSSVPGGALLGKWACLVAQTMRILSVGGGRCRGVVCRAVGAKAVLPFVGDAFGVNVVEPV